MLTSEEDRMVNLLCNAKEGGEGIMLSDNTSSLNVLKFSLKGMKFSFQTPSLSAIEFSLTC